MRLRVLSFVVFVLPALVNCSCSPVDASTAGRELDRPRPGMLGEPTALAVPFLVPGGVLSPGNAPASGTCDVVWDGSAIDGELSVNGTTASSSLSTFNGVTSTTAHDRGRRYFEVTFEFIGERSYNSVFVAADLPEAFFGGFALRDCLLGAGDCASVSSFGSGDVVSVLADLDNGRVDFAVNGVLTEFTPDAGIYGLYAPRLLAVLPGAGPFRAGVSLDQAASARANFGAEPFRFTPPAGFTAWGAGLDADDDGACISAPAIPLTPAPVSALVNCEAGYVLSSVATGVDVGDGPTLALFGNYRSPTGDVSVVVERPGRYVLVLGGYESTNWRVQAGDGVTIERVVARGYEGVTVEAPAGTAVETSSFVDGDEADYVAGNAWPFDLGGGDTLGFVGTAEAETGLPLAFFAGAPEAEGFTLQPDGTPTTECR
jgi:hypothetical protein